MSKQRPGREPPVAYVRIQRYDTPGQQAYAAVRAGELAAILARSDRVETVQQCWLDLPPDLAAALAAQLAAPLRPVRAVIGAVTGGTWVSGPLKGQRRPSPWNRLQGFPDRMAPGFRCTFVSTDGYRCDMLGELMRECPAHKPGIRWSELPPPDDDEDPGGA